MKLAGDSKALLSALIFSVLVIILLTPIGFETRPQSDLKTFGFVAIGIIFAGLALFVLSIGLLFRRVRFASKLAIVASILFIIPVVGDRAGAFFSVPIPPTIDILEDFLMVVLSVNIILAVAVYRKTEAT